ncbi:sedoheptulose-1,7-bisphosphatase [Xylaria sp. CBS 124048]|nr:sedoheptulose-1,7-bisphosphatase [Xylaria sp. CBS 124048]
MDPHLTDHLRKATGDSHQTLLTSVLPSLLRSIARTATALRSSHAVTQAGSDNVFGDAQLNVDVLAENIFREEIAACPAIVTASSEEDPVERSSTSISTSASTSNDEKEDEKEVYSLAFDPLDGSSIIAPNWSVGSIIGIWANTTTILNQSPLTSQIAAILGVYGPRTTAIIAIRTPGREENAVCAEVSISADDNTFHLQRSDLILSSDGPASETKKTTTTTTKYFAPANLRAASENEKYRSLITYFIDERYTLRYSGGLVPDVVHALVKGHGIYVSPVTDTSKAKLRRAYELLPIALVVECAGGAAIDPVSGERVLERGLGDLGEKGGLIFGCMDEVERVRGMLLG